MNHSKQILWHIILISLMNAMTKVDEAQSLHNTLSQEQALLRIVRKGDTADQPRACHSWRCAGKGAAPTEEKYLHRCCDAGIPHRHSGRHGCGGCLFPQ